MPYLEKASDQSSDLKSVANLIGYTLLLKYAVTTWLKYFFSGIIEKLAIFDGMNTDLSKWEMLDGSETCRLSFGVSTHYYSITFESLCNSQKYSSLSSILTNRKSKVYIEDLDSSKKIFTDKILIYELAANPKSLADKINQLGIDFTR